MIGNNVLAERDLTYVVEKETNNMVGKGRALGARAAVYCAINKWGLAVEVSNYIYNILHISLQSTVIN